MNDFIQFLFILSSQTYLKVQKMNEELLLTEMFVSYEIFL